jgi:hypothetical protein
MTMRWLYKYLEDRQDVLKVRKVNFTRLLERLSKRPADAHTQIELREAISSLERSREECDKIIQFITRWSRQEVQESGAQACPRCGADQTGHALIDGTCKGCARASRTLPRGAGEVEGGLTSDLNSSPPSVSPPAQADFERDVKLIESTINVGLFRSGIRVALDWASRNRSDNVRVSDEEEVIAWANMNQQVK